MKNHPHVSASRTICMLTLLLFVSFNAFAQAESFKWIRNVEQQNVRDYSEGRSAYYENGKWGFINQMGTVVIAPEYDEVEDFAGGVCLVKKGGKWGVIDKNGKFVHECEYESISGFDSGVAYAEKDMSSFYLYDTGKKTQLPSSKFAYFPFSDGLARIKNIKTGEWGYTDSKGIIAIDPEFTSASDFKNGHAFVSTKGKDYIINKKGDMRAAPFKLDTNVVIFSNGAGYLTAEDGNLRFFDKGFDVKSHKYLEINDFSNGVSRARREDGKIVIINEKGDHMLILNKYEDVGDFSEGLAWVKSNGKYGYVDMQGKLVIDTLFSYASDFRSEYAYVANGARQGVIKVAKMKDTFPMIHISDIQINDSSMNGTVEAEENFDISFKVSNIGDEVLNGATISLGVDQSQSDWFNFVTTKIDAGTLQPGEEKILTLSLASNAEIVSENINMNLKGEASNLYSSHSFDFNFPASGISACRPLLETFWVYTSDHSPLAPGKDAYLKMTVVNNGTDMARDVTVNLNWPEGIDYDEKSFVIPSLSPNETHEIVTTFKVPESASPSKDFTMVANVDEYTHKRNDVKYISFATGKMNILTNLLTGSMSMTGGAEAAPVIVRKAESELLIDLDQRIEINRNRVALVIGNEDYNSMKPNSAYQPDVEFAERDAETFAKYANKVMGVAEDNVILVKNATYAQMRNSLDKIKRLAKVAPDKLELIVYYAGHGQVDGETKESYLIPVDVSLTSPTSGLKLEDFYAEISSCKAEKTMVFLDACYSGVGRGIIIKPKSTPIEGNMVIMTATSSTQRSMPYHDKNHGLFTYYLLKTLKDSQPGVSISDLFNEVSASVRMKSVLINNSEQTPELLNGTGISQGWEDWTF